MNGTPWTPHEIARLRSRYADASCRELAARLGRSRASIYKMAKILGLKKSAAFYARERRRQTKRLRRLGAAYRFAPGHVPANKGLRRPGWFSGRMRETQFKKGYFPANRDPDFYVLGALRVNAEGYIDMRVSFAAGARGWRPLHRILWQDAHGPIPAGHIVVFRDRDRLNVCLENLELITLAEIMRRNTIHRLPAPLKEVIHLLGRVKRKINEKSHHGSA